MKKSKENLKKSDPVKYKLIQLTDIQIHTSLKRPTPSFGKKVRQAFEKHTPERVYSSIPKPLPEQEDNSFILEMLKLDPDFMKMVQEEEAKGYKVLIKIPEGGLTIFPGEDTIEFMNSKNGKRILRKLDSNKK